MPAGSLSGDAGSRISVAEYKGHNPATAAEIQNMVAWPGADPATEDQGVQGKAVSILGLLDNQSIAKAWVLCRSVCYGILFFSGCVFFKIF